MKAFTILLFIAVVCPAETVPPEKSFGSAERFRIAQSATECEAILVRSIAKKEEILAFEVTPIAEPRVVSHEVLAALKKMLFREWKKSESGASFCLPQPGMRYRLSSKVGVVSVLVCSQCGEFFVEEGEKLVGAGHCAPKEARAIAAMFMSTHDANRVP